MHHDLTAVFNNQGDAQRTLDELLLSGYPCSRTILVSPPSNGGVAQILSAGLGGMFKQMFVRLLGLKDHEPEKVDESAFLPGRHVILITGALEPDSVRAISIIERSNPVYIEDRHKQ